MKSIESAAETLAQAREALAKAVTDLQARLDAIQSAALPGIRKLGSAVANHTAALAELLRDNRALFDKPHPKTRLIHGIKVGYAKSRGAIEIPDPERTVQLAERLFADNPDLLALIVSVKKFPNKEGIEDLPVSDAKKIGCHIREAVDQIVIKHSDGEIDKLVKTLLATALEEALAA